MPTGSGANWQASREVSAGEAEGVLSFSIDYADFAGNAGPSVSDTTDASSVTVNTNAATVVIQGAPASFVTLAPIPVSFEFSKPVTGFELGDIGVTNGAASGFVATRRRQLLRGGNAQRYWQPSDRRSGRRGVGCRRRTERSGG